jgi:hypothetical protein
MSLAMMSRLIVMLSGLGLLVFGGYLLGWQLHAEAQDVCIRGQPCSIDFPFGFHIKAQYPGEIVIAIGAVLQITALIGLSRLKAPDKLKDASS